MDTSPAIYLVGQGTYFRPRPIEVQFHRILRFTQLEGQKDTWFDARALFIDLSPRIWRSQRPDFEREYPEFLQLLNYIKQKKCKTVFVDFDTSTTNPIAGILLSMESALLESDTRVINCYWKTLDYQQEHSTWPFSEKGDACDFITFFPNLTADICEIVMHDPQTDTEKGSALEKLRHRIKSLHQEQANRSTGNKWPLLPWWVDKRSARGPMK